LRSQSRRAAYAIVGRHVPRNGDSMNKYDPKGDLWQINTELVKAGIEPWKYKSMALAVKALREKLEAAQQNVQRTDESVGEKVE